MEEDEKCMRLALAQALGAKQAGDVPFGAVIICDGQVVAVARNSEHNDQDVTKHAEIKAISLASRRLAQRDLSNCTIYSTVEPCPMCAGAIFHAWVARVVYAMSRDDLPHLFRSRAIRLWDLAKDWHYEPKVIGGLLRQPAIDLFLEYKQPFRVQPEITVSLQNAGIPA
jgi:tRNA(adenine34) deaminase